MNFRAWRTCDLMWDGIFFAIFIYEAVCQGVSYDTHARTTNTTFCTRLHVTNMHTYGVEKHRQALHHFSNIKSKFWCTLVRFSGSKQPSTKHHRWQLSGILNIVAFKSLESHRLEGHALNKFINCVNGCDRMHALWSQHGQRGETLSSIDYFGHDTHMKLRLTVSSVRVKVQGTYVPCIQRENLLYCIVPPA